VRQRFRPLRMRSMARRPGDGGRRLVLTPQQQRIAGWLIAAVIIAAIAILLGVLGGNGDGTAVNPQTTPSPSNAATAITFGTQLDPATGRIVTGTETTTFTTGDTFAYALPPSSPLPEVVFVEVIRTSGETPVIVQAAATDGEQHVPPGRPAVGFDVAADVLVEVFGPGSYEMRIYRDPTETPIGTGAFTLTEPPASLPATGSPVPSTSP
jgi:hypothetical protein